MIIFKKLLGVTRYLNPALAFREVVRPNQEPKKCDTTTADHNDNVSETVLTTLSPQHDALLHIPSSNPPTGSSVARQQQRFWLIRWVLLFFNLFKKQRAIEHNSVSQNGIEGFTKLAEHSDSLGDADNQQVSELEDNDDTVVSILAYRMTADHKDKESWNSLKGEDFDQAFEAWFEHLTESADTSTQAQSRRASLKLVHDAATASSSPNGGVASGEKSTWVKNSVWDRPSRIEYLDSGPPTSRRGELSQLRLTWADGRTYQGQTLGLKPQGFGVMQWPDGRRYEGHFHRGLSHGQGLLVLPNGERFSGEFASGKPCLKLCTLAPHIE